jgi:hypothetical protein
VEVSTAGAHSLQPGLSRLGRYRFDNNDENLTTIIPLGLVFADPKRLALDGFLAGYSAPIHAPPCAMTLRYDWARVSLDAHATYIVRLPRRPGNQPSMGLCAETIIALARKSTVLLAIVGPLAH